MHTEEQYRQTRKSIAEFQEALLLASLLDIPPDLDPLFSRAIVDGMKSQLSDLLQEARDYEEVRRDRRKSTPN